MSVNPRTSVWSALPSIGDTLSRAGLKPDKKLGQNFLLDPGLLGRIVRAAGDIEGRNVVEIGPGPGGLSRSILDAGAKQLTVIERDLRCLPILEELADQSSGRLQILHHDALAVDWSTQLQPNTHIIANLPYNIATKLILSWLEHRTTLQSITVLIQKEVAQRLTAQSGTKDWGRLAIRTQWDWHATRCFDVGPKAFVPPPKVTSSVVHLTPREKPQFEARLAMLERVTAAAFQQRRKMLRQSLKSISKDPVRLCEVAGLSPEWRADVVTIQGFCALANALDQDLTKH